MKITDFDAHVQTLFRGCEDLLLRKGADYTGSEDRLANFKRGAERLGLSKYQILSVYFAKHIDAIFNSIKKSPDYPQVESEPIQERIKDAINYLVLLSAMVEEDFVRENVPMKQKRHNSSIPEKIITPYRPVTDPFSQDDLSTPR